MRQDAIYDPITVDSFFEMKFPDDRNYVLVDGVIYMMAGGTPARARVAANILGYLGVRLRGSGCRPYGSDLGVQVSETNLRYPDISIYCGDPATPEREHQRAFADPVVVIEVLSSSTAHNDEGEKLRQYRSIASVDTVVFVDPHRELSRVVQRIGPTSWRDDLFAQPHDITLPAVNVTVPHAEIFARD